MLLPIEEAKKRRALFLQKKYADKVKVYLRVAGLETAFSRNFAVDLTRTLRLANLKLRNRKLSGRESGTFNAVD